MSVWLPYAYVSEVVQTLSACCGFPLGIWAVWDAWKEGVYWRRQYEDERELGRANTEVAARVALTEVHFKSELASLVASVIFLVVGISGLFLAPPDGHARMYDSELLGIAVSRYGMTAVSLVLAYKSIVRRRGRMAYTTIRRRTDPGGARLSVPTGMVASKDQS